MSIFGMHHEKLDVIVFAIDLEIIDGQKKSARNFVSRITENVALGAFSSQAPAQGPKGASMLKQRMIPRGTHVKNL